MVYLHTGPMGVYRACFFIARAGRAATPERNRSGNQPLYLVHPASRRHQLASARQSFRMFTAQLICQGACRQVDIVRTFGVSKQSVIRSINKYRAGGVKASTRLVRHAALP